MKERASKRAGRADRESGSPRFSPTQMAAAGLSGAIILIVVMVVIFLLGHM
jgi:hypothetical protein